MLGVAWAMGAGGSGSPQGGMAAFAQFVPLLLIGGVFYFMLIRPQQKKQKDTQEMLSNLKKGNRVITTGGIHGKIVTITDKTITLEVSNNARIEFTRASINQVES